MSRRDTPPTVIGIMPPGVRFLPSPGNSQEPNYNVNAQVDFWEPVTPGEKWLKVPSWDVVGRLRGGVTTSQAQSELAVIAGLGGARRQGVRRLRSAGTVARQLLLESRRYSAHPAPAAGRGGPGAPHRVRKYGGPVAGAGSAAATGIRGAQRAGERTAGSVPAGVHGKPVTRAVGRRVGGSAGIRHCQSVQDHRRAREVPRAWML